MYVGDDTSYSGRCPEPLWHQLKELSPADHRLERTLNYGVALLVATYRYDELSGEARQVVDQMLADEAMPRPTRTDDGVNVDALVADLQSSRTGLSSEDGDVIEQTTTEHPTEQSQ